MILGDLAEGCWLLTTAGRKKEEEKNCPGVGVGGLLTTAHPCFFEQILRPDSLLGSQARCDV